MGRMSRLNPVAKIEREVRILTPDEAFPYRYGIRLNWLPVTLKNRARASVNKKTKRVQFFPDKRVVEDQRAIHAAAVQFVKVPLEQRGMPWRLLFTVQREQSATEWKTGIPNRRRGDLVNMHESICDALEGFWFEDDSQVTWFCSQETRKNEKNYVEVKGSPMGLDTPHGLVAIDLHGRPMKCQS